MKAFSGLVASFALLYARSAFATGSLEARNPSPSPTTATSQASAAAATQNSNAGMQGDSRCVTTMCVAAVVNGSTVTYTLTSRRSSVGWMGMGFGSRMVGSPMVIMWANADGSVILSQRQATAQVNPTVVANPPRIATVDTSLSVTSGSNVQFVYSIPANGATTQTIIYAFGTVNPGSSSSDAVLVQHIDQGTMSLDLSKTIPVATTTPTTGGSTDGGIPLSSSDKLTFAHAIIATIGFILFLPIGALLPRYLRTFVAGPTWFKSHWIVQFILGGTTIIIGVALGIASVSNRGSPHVDTTHKRLGVALFALYFFQLGIGSFIHWVKPKTPRARPPQNYFHAIVGIVIIGLALYQIRLGYRNEWTRATGRSDVPSGVNIVWYIWVVLLPVAYGAGMAFLPKQYAQERKTLALSGYDR